MTGDALVCPSCGRRHPASERFCAVDGMPLVRADGPQEVEATSEAQTRARKVLRQYTEGPLVRVASVRHPAEAELIRGLLLEHGVPSTVVRPGGSSVPITGEALSRVLVPASGEAAAREALASDVGRAPRTPSSALGVGRRRAMRMTAGTLVLAVSAIGIAQVLEVIAG